MLRRRPPDAPTLSDRAAPLIEEAAERSKVSWGTRVERLRLAWRSIFQASVSAALAWLIATEVLGHPRPFFAPVSAIITLGITVGQRPQRAAEVALGVALGIAVADLLVLEIGTGTAQLALVVGLATSAAIFLGSGQMLATQAAVSAALVATLQPPTHGVSFARFTDALVGGGVALAINALLLPARPLDLMRRASTPLLEELASVLEDVAVAVERRDRERAVAALERARSVDEFAARFDDAVEVSRETTRYAPPRRRARGAVESYADAAARIDLAVRNVRVLARGVIRALSLDENVPPEIAESLRDLASAVRALPDALDDEGAVAAVHECAVRAAAQATLVLERTGNMSVSVIVGQIRSTAADLLAATGMSGDRAAGEVREAVREAEASQ
ncbi:MAG TPA: FUSC family protein [Solirubrobacteraceae bacterium]|nr:FUSC family protein [Solirubrobacteraceae bacterium]